VCGRAIAQKGLSKNGNCGGTVGQGESIKGKKNFFMSEGVAAGSRQGGRGESVMSSRGRAVGGGKKKTPRQTKVLH